MNNMLIILFQLYKYLQLSLLFPTLGHGDSEKDSNAKLSFFFFGKFLFFLSFPSLIYLPLILPVDQREGGGVGGGGGGGAEAG